MWRTFFKILFAFILLLVVLIGGFVATVYYGFFGHIANKQQLTEFKQAQATVVYSDDGEIIGKFFYTNRTNIPYEKLPKHLIQALIATEDARFYEHKGIDKTALLRVIFKSLILGNSSAGGGSTLSQQLAKNLFERENHSFFTLPVNKTKEAILANRLENIYSKEEILTLYLNTVPFGEKVFGIESAAQRYFSKSTNQLTLDESAVLVGILKANTYYNPQRNPDHAFIRRNVVLNQMRKEGYLLAEQYNYLRQKPIKTNYSNLELENPNGYFLHQVKNQAKELLARYPKTDGGTWDLQQDGLIIETSLNSEMQNAAMEARQAHLKKLQKTMDAYWETVKNKKNITALIEKEWQQTPEYKHLKDIGSSNTSLSHNMGKKTERRVFDWDEKVHFLNKKDSIAHYLKMVNASVYGMNLISGAVQIYIGGNNFEYLPYDLIQSERQTASTFKPIVYMAALEAGKQPCDWIDNEEKIYEAHNNWKPQNYDNSNGGYYSMVGALAKSVNLPTVATYFNVGAEQLQKTANALGLRKDVSKNPSTALGTLNYSLQDMIQAYVPFATRGNSVKPYFISAIKDAQGNTIYQHQNYYIPTDLDPYQLQTMQYLLKGVVEKGTAAGLKSRYTAKGDWAGKTGTSQEYSDSWFIGFNSNFIIGTWVGCKYPSIHLPSKIGGGSVAALPIVGQIISKNYLSSKTNHHLSAGFPPFYESIVSNCDCDFFREENTIEKIFDVFDQKQKKKENFFTRLFGRKKSKKE